MLASVGFMMQDGWRQMLMIASDALVTIMYDVQWSGRKPWYKGKCGDMNFRGVQTKQLGLRVMTWELGDEDMNMSWMLVSWEDRGKRIKAPKGMKMKAER